MKKSLWILLSVVLLTTVVALPASASGGKVRHRTGTRFSLVGQVTEIDPETQTVTVMVLQGNRFVKDHIDAELTISTTEDTVYRKYGDPPHVFITFDEITEDDYVSMMGLVTTEGEAESEVFTAERITTDVSPECVQ
jgi:hypothetical protein